MRLFFYFPNPPLQFATRPFWARPSPVPMCITPEAYEYVAQTVGRFPPETGAKGFGPLGRLGFEVVEFDEEGSRHATGSIYSPHVPWGNERCDYWIRQPEPKLWSGDWHSHPGTSGVPSSRSGKGLGDMGYSFEVLSQNETMQYFLMPIVTHVGTRAPLLWPWVISRTDPHTPLWADAYICPVQDFPVRVFNPEWEYQVSTPPINLAQLTDLLGSPIAQSNQVGDALHLLVVWHGITLYVILPCGFPEVPPQISSLHAQRYVPYECAWHISLERIGEPEAALVSVFQDLLSQSEVVASQGDTNS